MPEKEPPEDVLSAIALHEPAKIGGLQDRGAEHENEPRSS
jgi:hypothetical protein